MTAELTFAKDKKDGILLAKFSNANLSNDNGMRFGLFQDTEMDVSKRKRRRKQLVAETDKMTYVGKNYGAYAATENDLAKYLVGVFDKKTNKVKIYNSEIFLLHPHFPDDKKDAEDEVDLGESYRSKIDALTEAFGVGKKKRAVSKRQQIQIGTEAMNSAMQSAVALAKKQPSIISDPAPQQDDPGSIIPPHHRDATKPQDAYLLDDLISVEEMEVLKTPAQAFTTVSQQELKEMQSAGKICAFVLSQLKILPVAQDAQLQKACVVTYLQYLIDIFKMKADAVKRKDFLPEEMPGLIKKKITNEFTILARGGRKPNPVRCMPTKMKDKLLMHILVIGLILDDFNLEYSSLMADLKIPPMRLNRTLKALGCSSKIQKVKVPGESDVSIRVATLQVPLKFPEKTTPKKSRPV